MVRRSDSLFAAQIEDIRGHDVPHLIIWHDPGLVRQHPDVREYFNRSSIYRNMEQLWLLLNHESIHGMGTQRLIDQYDGFINLTQVYIFGTSFMVAGG